MEDILKILEDIVLNLKDQSLICKHALMSYIVLYG